MDKLDEISNNSNKAFWARSGLNGRLTRLAFPVGVTSPRAVGAQVYVSVMTIIGDVAFFRIYVVRPGVGVEGLFLAFGARFGVATS